MWRLRFTFAPARGESLSGQSVVHRAMAAVVDQECEEHQHGKFLFNSIFMRVCLTVYQHLLLCNAALIAKGN